MDTVVRTAIVYLFLLALLRFAGRRTLAKATTFDLVLLLIIGGTTQRALLGEDYSVISAMLVVVTLVVLDVGFSLAERDSPAFAKIVNGSPMVLIADGRPLLERIRKARLTEDEIMSIARHARAIERMEDIKFAILEANGEISIIPTRPEPEANV